MADWPAGPALDAEIARRFFGEQVGQYGAGDDVHRFITSHGLVRDLPRYSTDLVTAWAIVEQLQARGCVVHLTAYPTDAAAARRARPGSETMVYHCRVEQVVLGVHRRLAEAQASSAPLAVCRAALLTCR